MASKNANQGLLSLADFARLRGVSRARVTQYKRSGMPMQGTMVPVREAVGWIEANVDGTGRKRGPAPEDTRPSGERLLESQIQRNEIFTKLKDLEFRKRQGELLERHDVLDAWTKVIAATRSRLLLVPGKLAHRLSTASDPVKCEAILDAEIKAALRELSEHKIEGPEAA